MHRKMHRFAIFLAGAAIVLLLGTAAPRSENTATAQLPVQPTAGQVWGRYTVVSGGTPMGAQMLCLDTLTGRTWVLGVTQTPDDPPQRRFIWVPVTFGADE